jgi:hypothetical protein
LSHLPQQHRRRAAVGCSYAYRSQLGTVDLSLSSLATNLQTRFVQMSEAVQAPSR